MCQPIDVSVQIEQHPHQIFHVVTGKGGLSALEGVENRAGRVERHDGRLSRSCGNRKPEGLSTIDHQPRDQDRRLRHDGDLFGRGEQRRLDLDQLGHRGGRWERLLQVVPHRVEFETVEQVLDLIPVPFPGAEVLDLHPQVHVIDQPHELPVEEHLLPMRRQVLLELWRQVGHGQEEIVEISMLGDQA